MVSENPTPAEVFNTGLESFCRGDVDEAVACLRVGFFENLYIAPTLLEKEFTTQDIWYPGAEAEPRAALEYTARYGQLWGERTDALRFLEELWNDPLVRGELRSFVNISKAILQTQSDLQQSDMIKERKRFTDFRRIRRTQSEIISRLMAGNYLRPIKRPQVGLILLAVRDPIETVAFYRKLFQIEPSKTSRHAGGYAEFELPGVHLAIHGYDRLGQGDPYGLGKPPQSLGWGAIFVIMTEEIDRYFKNASANRLDVVDSDLITSGKRFFVVKDPSGYLMEITEEQQPRGM